jgi:nitrite reductase (NO-forming)
MINRFQNAILIISVLTAILFACTPQPGLSGSVSQVDGQSNPPLSVDATFTLRTDAGNGKLLYVGVGGDIDGIINPDLNVKPGTVVRIVLVNGDGMPHDLFLPDWDVKSDYVSKVDDQTTIIFEVGNKQPGPYVYYCTVPGHRQAGQEGQIIISNP